VINRKKVESERVCSSSKRKNLKNQLTSLIGINILGVDYFLGRKVFRRINDLQGEEKRGGTKKKSAE